MKYLNKIAVLVLFFVALLVTQILHAKGVVGAYEGRVNDSYTFNNSNDSFVMDEAGTRWNIVDDIMKRQMNRADRIDYNFQVNPSSAGAVTLQGGEYVLFSGSGSYTADNIGDMIGWTLVIPTNSVSCDRTSIDVYNPITNTLTYYVNYATGALSGLLSYPNTNYYVMDILPGEKWTVKVSSFIHPVIAATGTIKTESVQSTQKK